ncbi:MOSC domain-containing protein [Sungkyunkwania multivorans]|uniref:MOSC domain-containing protein n=1 Tax=Sungkyunkwania multivorans TaxID=1173618 RepID=A0ABW3CVJ8_9FLAO
MKVIATNIAEPGFILWKGKEEKTGIFKTPTAHPIFLGKETVKGDEVSNRKVHGGSYKACYLFSADHYPYWKQKYPDLDWNWGMFGENLTVAGLDEHEIFIGDIYKIGDALVQITQPREPCYKFGVKFGTQKVLKEFIAHGHPGTYVKVLEEGEVATGDELVLAERHTDAVTTAQFFEFLFAQVKNRSILEKILKLDSIPAEKRKKLSIFLDKA